MPKKPLSYLRPQTLDEALKLLAQPDAVPLAGGTQLLASEAGVTAAHVVDLQALGLNRIALTAGTLTIGATATLTVLADFLAQDPPAAAGHLLQHALRYAGPNTYRNAATPGGIIAGRLADSELLAALLVLEAGLRLQGAPDTRMPLAAYLAADARPAGLITAVEIPWTDGRGGSDRVARTPQDSPIVSVTWWQPSDAAVRLAATGIGPRPLRLTAVERALAGGLDEASIALAADAAAGASTHPGDFRGSAGYRREMAAVLTRRLLRSAAGLASET